MMKKRMMSVLLVLTLLVSCLPVGAFAEEIVLTEIPEAVEAPAPETEEPETLPEETEKTQIQEPVFSRVSFQCAPVQAVVTVCDGKGSCILAEEDGTYLLVPGQYYYRAECDGYVPVEETVFEVGAEDAEICIELQELEPEETALAEEPALQQQEAAIPIIVVPGVMGSRLFKDVSCSTASLVWGSANAIFDTASQNGAAMAIENTLYVRGHEGLFRETDRDKEYGTIDIYKNLVEFLCATYPDREVYFYSYDWRQSNVTSAQKLHQALTELEIDKAVFIGHSMGGLVLSNYVAAYSADAVEKILTLGTPYEGATRLMEAVLTDKVLTGIAGAGNPLLEKGGLTYDIKRNLPGVAELSPNMLYLQNVNTENRCYYASVDTANALTMPSSEGMEAVVNLDGLKAWLQAPYAVDTAQKELKIRAGQWLEDLENAYARQSAVLTDVTVSIAENTVTVTPHKETSYPYEEVLAQVYPNYAAVAEAQNSAQEGVQLLYGMSNAYFAVGDSMNTMSGITMVNRDGILYPRMYDYLSVGDGTVPFISANMLRDQALPRTRYFDLEHNELSGYSGKQEWTKVKRWMRSVIEDTVMENSGRTAPRTSSGMIVLRVDAAAEVSVKRGSEILATVLKGVHITTNSGVVNLVNYDTSFGTLDFAGENSEIKVFCLEPYDDYEITIEGTEEGTMDYSLRFYDSTDTLRKELAVRDVPLTQSTTVTTGTDASGPILLYLDTDGDKRKDEEYLLTNEDGSDRPVNVEQEYILLAQGQTGQVSALAEPADLASHIRWVATDLDGVLFEDDPVITVDAQTGEITALREGTAYVVACLENGSNLFSDRCRVDVTAEETAEGEAPSVVPSIRNVSLPVDKVTVELYRTEYTEFAVIPELEQLLSYSASALRPASELPQTENTGAAIQEAAFVDAQTAAVFDLKVTDDRTLKIVPKYSALEASQRSGSAVKSSYKSAIRLVIDGEEFITSDASGKEQQLKLTVKKTLPKISPESLELHTSLAQQQMLNFGDTRVTAMEKDAQTAHMNPKTDASAWLDVDYTTGQVSLKRGATYQKTGKLYLTLTLADWAVKQNVAVNVKVSTTAPKLTLKPSSVTVLSESYDRAEIGYQITPAEFAGQTPEVLWITEGSGLNLKMYANGEVLRCECTGDKIIVGAAKAPADGKTHTYKVYLKLAEKEYTFTVKVLPRNTKVSATVRASGSINTGVAKSPVTLKVSIKNYHPEAVKRYGLEIRQYKSATKTTPEVDRVVTDQFDIRQDGNVFTLTEARQGILESGYTYYAYVTAEIGDVVTVEAAKAKLNIKWGDPAKLPVSVSLKASGSIDTIRPGTTVTLTPTFKNYYGYTLKPEDISFYRTYKTRVDGKTVTVKDEYAADYFDVAVRSGAYRVTLRDGVRLTASDSFKAMMRITIGENSYESKLCSVKLTTGKAKFTAEPAAVSLLLKDRYSRDTFTLTTQDDTLAEISHITMDAGSAKYFAITDLGGGTYQIAYKDDLIPRGLKAGKKTVKLNVYLEGAPEDKVCASVSVAVQIK